VIHHVRAKGGEGGDGEVVGGIGNSTSPARGGLLAAPVASVDDRLVVVIDKTPALVDVDTPCLTRRLRPTCLNAPSGTRTKRVGGRRFLVVRPECYDDRGYSTDLRLLVER
jgi:hypothetical protein